jgi:rRNA small subunit pseudouridine methyltransferase Nep1
LYIHTIDNKVIRFGKNVHLPKSYHRFQGVIEKLYQEKKILSKNELLLDIKEQTFSELIDEINPSNIIGFSTEGEQSSYQKIASKIPDNSCIILGGFQKGHFSDSIQNKITNLYSVGNESFEAHVVVSRILYEYEKTIFM